MAYDKKFFTLGRGSYNNYATLDNAAYHIYKTADDFLSTIIAPGYFPADFNFDVNNVKIGDIIDIYGSNNNSRYVITDVTNPAFALTDDAAQKEFIFNTTLTGIYAAPQPITITLLKVGRNVTVQIPNVSSTASIASTITSVDKVGAELVPTISTQYLVGVDDNGSAVQGTLVIVGEDDAPNAGEFRWGVGVGLGSFVGTGDSGVIRTSVSYITT